MPTVPIIMRTRLSSPMATLSNLAPMSNCLSSQKQNNPKVSKWMKATVNEPANGLNNKHVPKATACELKRNEKFLFQRFSCHGRSALSSEFWAGLWQKYVVLSSSRSIQKYVPELAHAAHCSESLWKHSWTWKCATADLQNRSRT